MVGIWIFMTVLSFLYLKNNIKCWKNKQKTPNITTKSLTIHYQKKKTNHIPLGDHTPVLEAAAWFVIDEAFLGTLPNFEQNILLV